MNKLQELYSGKAKSVYATDNPDRFVLEFRNDTSAFDGKKVEQLDRKGKVNNLFNAFIMEKLDAAGIPTHFDRVISDNQSIVKKLNMLPLECVVRNLAAGSICRRLGIEEGTNLTPPTYELFLKDDSLGDPMVNAHHAITFGWATLDQIERMQQLTFAANDVLKKLFSDAGLLLVDYKLEFGIYNGEITLGDEFSPDGCRIWDKETRKKLDKDRFRQGLGGVVEAYEEVGLRLGMEFG